MFPHQPHPPPCHTLLPSLSRASSTAARPLPSHRTPSPTRRTGTRDSGPGPDGPAETFGGGGTILAASDREGVVVAESVTGPRAAGVGTGESGGGNNKGLEEAKVDKLEPGPGRLGTTSAARKWR